MTENKNTNQSNLKIDMTQNKHPIYKKNTHYTPKRKNSNTAIYLCLHPSVYLSLNTTKLPPSIQYRQNDFDSRYPPKKKRKKNLILPLFTFLKCQIVSSLCYLCLRNICFLATLVCPWATFYFLSLT